MPNLKRISVSKSQAEVMQHCEQEYYFSYWLYLQRRGGNIPLALGNVLHAYLEAYYNQFLELEGVPSSDGHASTLASAHTRAWEVAEGIWKPKVRKYQRQAESLGAAELAADLRGMLPKAQRIAQRYFEARGVYDPNRYKFLAVEMPVETNLRHSHTVSKGKVDVVSQDRATGRISIWEHKTTKDVPPNGVRLRDLQTALYELQVPWDIDSVIWNYIRTKEPTIPKPLKRGGLSRDKGMDTTWGVYHKALLDNGINPIDYLDVKERLEHREKDVFLPRYEQVGVVGKQVIKNYEGVARRIEQRREGYANGKQPIMTLSRDCNWCAFNRLCLAKLTGGDVEDVIALEYEAKSYD